jgi:hypothetical protein
MITIKSENHVYGLTPSEIYGLSTDVKPTDVNNASVFYEMDTKKLFMFDEENSVWREC